MKRLVLLLVAIAACQAELTTPEDIAKMGHEGQRYTARGTVFTLTFDDQMLASDNFPVGPDRWVLMRTKVPAGVTAPDLTGGIEAAWGLGIHINGATAATTSLPQIGDAISVSGRFYRGDWAGNKMPMLEPDAIKVEAGSFAGAAAGASCQVDDDCADYLICNSGICGNLPQPILWGSAWHDVNGACDSDADCPAGQSCDLSYAIQATGLYSPDYHTEDVGRHLCVPAAGQTMASLCPRIHPVADLLGGRFVPGKEVCVTGSIFVAVVVEDRDTHVQLAVAEPLPYPVATTGYELFGATTENSPPYKDPARSSPVVDPMLNQKVVALGTYRYDDGHGWFEVHPVKAYFPITP
jgi:hypothetical protein